MHLKQNTEDKDYCCKSIFDQAKVIDCFCTCTHCINGTWCEQVLVSLTPWMEQLSLLPGDCENSDGLLKSMYYVTQLHGSRFSYEVEKLWSTVAGNPKNVRPLLDFLVSYGVDECSVQVNQ